MLLALRRRNERRKKKKMGEQKTRARESRSRRDTIWRVTAPSRPDGCGGGGRTTARTCPNVFLSFFFFRSFFSFIVFIIAIGRPLPRRNSDEPYVVNTILYLQDITNVSHALQKRNTKKKKKKLTVYKRRKHNRNVYIIFLL